MTMSELNEIDVFVLTFCLESKFIFTFVGFLIPLTDTVMIPSSIATTSPVKFLALAIRLSPFEFSYYLLYFMFEFLGGALCPFI